MPGYLATISGSQLARVLMRSVTFVSTFSVIFILLGLGATAAGAFWFDNQQTLNTVAGVAIIAMGVVFVASVFLPRLNRDWRPDAVMSRTGSGGPVIAGAAFAIAWTPCVGPTLGAILGLATTSSGTAQGALLLTAYSAGLALPFLATAAAFNRAQDAFAFFRRHYGTIHAVGGVLLIVMGLLVVTGELFRLNMEAQLLLDRLGVNFFKSI